jgi:hypothetical protein
MHMADVAAALRGLLDHQSEMQQLVLRYFQQELTEQQFVGGIIEMLDGPVQRDRTKLAREALREAERRQ